MEVELFLEKIVFIIILLAVFGAALQGYIEHYRGRWK